LGTVRDAMLFLADGNETTLRDALETVNVWTVLEEKNQADPLTAAIDGLSVGQRQRVAIARVLARDAELYLLDEPDANLDRPGIERLVEILRDLSKRAVVIVAAHTPELAAIADHTIVLDRGRVVRDERMSAPVNVSELPHSGKRGLA